MTWLRQFRRALRANDLLGYVNGIYLRPEPYIIITNAKNQSRASLNPEFQQWVKIDRQLVSCILSTISTSVLGTLDEYEHAAELWHYLLHRFSSLSHSIYMN